MHVPHSPTHSPAPLSLNNHYQNVLSKKWKIIWYNLSTELWNLEIWNIEKQYFLQSILIALNLNNSILVGKNENFENKTENKILLKSPLHICNHYIKKKINILVEDKGNFLAVRDQHKVALLTIRCALQK